MLLFSPFFIFISKIFKVINKDIVNCYAGAPQFHFRLHYTPSFFVNNQNLIVNSKLYELKNNTKFYNEESGKDMRYTDNVDVRLKSALNDEDEVRIIYNITNDDTIANINYEINMIEQNIYKKYIIDILSDPTINIIYKTQFISKNIDENIDEKTDENKLKINIKNGGLYKDWNTFF
jgi:hypothetical protein